MADSKQRLPKRQSTQTKKISKPKKPYEGFPLYAHATRRWCKKVGGRNIYFGYWAEVREGKVVRLPDNGWKAALALYEHQKDDLIAGRTPRPIEESLPQKSPTPDPEDNRVTLRELVNAYLTSKQHALDCDELSPRTFHDYRKVCECLLDYFGRDFVVDELRPTNFAEYRSSLARTRKAVSLSNMITRSKMIFKFGVDEEILDRAVCYGQGFKKPSKRVLRIQRQGKGKRMFESDELALILANAPMPLLAMVLLGANCGLGQSDIAQLPQSAIDFQNGWLDYPRPKTGIERRCKLWDITISALRFAIEHRPKPKDKADSNLVFLTKTGQKWVRLNPNGEGTANDVVAKQFSKLLKRLNLKRHRLNFYALRHGFQTIAGESRDAEAVSHVMGHVDSSMAGLYREAISDERLENVANTVFQWLFGSEVK